MKKVRDDYKADFEHQYNPLHVYSRLVEMDIPEDEARKRVATYEKEFYNPVMRSVRKREPLTLEEKLKCNRVGLFVIAGLGIYAMYRGIK